MTAFPTLRPAPTLVLVAAIALTVYGCTTGPSDQGTKEDPTTETATSSQAEAGKSLTCEDNTSGIEIFTGDGVTNPPESGQTWGDGTELSFDYAGFIPGSTLNYDLSYVQDDGSVIGITGGFFEEPTGTTFSNVDPQFDSASVGYPGIVEVSMLSNVEFDGEKYTGDTTPVATFCVTLAVAE